MRYFAVICVVLVSCSMAFAQAGNELQVVVTARMWSDGSGGSYRLNLHFHSGASFVFNAGEPVEIVVWHRLEHNTSGAWVAQGDWERTLLRLSRSDAFVCLTASGALSGEVFAPLNYGGTLNSQFTDQWYIEPRVPPSAGWAGMSLAANHFYSLQVSWSGNTSFLPKTHEDIDPGTEEPIESEDGVGWREVFESEEVRDEAEALKDRVPFTIPTLEASDNIRLDVNSVLTLVYPDFPHEEYSPWSYFGADTANGVVHRFFDSLDLAKDRFDFAFVALKVFCTCAYVLAFFNALIRWFFYASGMEYKEHPFDSASDARAEVIRENF